MLSKEATDDISVMIASMNTVETRRCPVAAGLVLALLLAAGCSGSGATTRRARAGTPAPAPGIQPADEPPSADQVISPEVLKKADALLPRPRPLPTISTINFSAFPNDLHGGHGKSKRQVLVKPGKPGVIAEALAAAAAGDTILLEQGVYREGEADDDGALRITKPGIVLRALPGKKARILPRAAGTKRGVLISASDVMVHGLVLDGFSAAGVAIGKEGATVRGVVISEVEVLSDKKSTWVDGIVVWPDNRAAGKPASDGLLIRNVTVQDATLGVSCGAGPCKSWWLENVRITNRAGTGEGSDAVAVEDGEDLVMVNVSVSRASADGVDVKAKNVLVLGSHVAHVGGNGLHLWRGGDVVNSLVHDTGGDGAVVLHSGRYRLLNTVVAFHKATRGKRHCLTAGRGEGGAAQVELINSIFYSSTAGLYFAGQTRPRIHNCLFHGFQSSVVLEARGKAGRVTVRASQPAGVFQKLGLGRNNLFMDPRFSGSHKGDFRLTEQSPAVNAGRKVVPFPAQDMVGNPRMRGSAPDLGPYELY